MDFVNLNKQYIKNNLKWLLLIPPRQSTISSVNLIGLFVKIWDGSLPKVYSKSPWKIAVYSLTNIDLWSLSTSDSDSASDSDFELDIMVIYWSWYEYRYILFLW